MPPKAPPIYKPNSPRVAGPPVYRPQTKQQVTQPKQANTFKLENRPAPPVYRPQQTRNVDVQPKVAGHIRQDAKAALPIYRPQHAAGSATPLQTKVVWPPVHGTTIQGKSKTKDLPERDRPIELGGSLNGRLFLFKGGEGRTKLLISAHGAHKLETKPSTIPVPDNMTVHFYAVHGELVRDIGLVLPPGDHVTRGNGERVANYTLAKYQGRHSLANETYEDIVLAVRTNDFDVLTVRHRFYSKEITLQEVLTAIAGRGYTDIYLNACQYAEVYSEEGLEMRYKDFDKLGYERI